MSTKRRPSVRPPVRPPPADGRPHNRLLAALPADDFRRLLPHLKTVRIRPKQVVLKEGELIERVYFPNGGVFSVTTPLSDGTSIEVATIGDEGMLGTEAFLTDDAVANGDTMMQVPDGQVTMLPVQAFRHEVAQRGVLRDLIGRYTQVLMAQMARSTACNALHEVQHRCARWLLMTHDRMHEQDFHLSHEFLAVMLGVQRPTVSVVAATLQRTGLISYRQGLVTVLDRKGLEAASCECYALIRAQFDRLRQ
jgi:CRP-like cAMP-binding protein